MSCEVIRSVTSFRFPIFFIQSSYSRENGCIPHMQQPVLPKFTADRRKNRCHIRRDLAREIVSESAAFSMEETGRFPPRAVSEAYRIPEFQMDIIRWKFDKKRGALRISLPRNLLLPENTRQKEINALYYCHTDRGKAR